MRERIIKYLQPLIRAIIIAVFIIVCWRGLDWVVGWPWTSSYVDVFFAALTGAWIAS